MTVTEFCRDVDTRIRELLHHQRFPVRTWRAAPAARDWKPIVSPSTHALRLTLTFGGAEATASHHNHGPVGHFGLFFLGSGDELALSTAGLGEPYASIGAAGLGARLQRIIAAMAADPIDPSSLDLLVDDERARLDDGPTPRALSSAAPAPVSIPEVFAAQVSWAPEALAVRFGSLVELPGVGRGLRTGWRSCWSPGARAGSVCGAVAAAFGPGDRGDAGRAQERRGVSADRSACPWRGWTSCLPTPPRSA